MKRIWIAALTSLAAAAVVTGQVGAWGGCDGCQPKIRGYVYGHQYNAFSPYCVDGSCFKRCRPLCHRCNWLPVYAAPAQPACAPACPPACGSYGCGDGVAEFSPHGMMMPSGPAPAPGVPAPTFKGPMPTPADGSQPAAPGAMLQGPGMMPYYGQPTVAGPMGYPGQMPGYGGMPAMPPMMGAPGGF